jgi:hypothetical protein
VAVRDRSRTATAGPDRKAAPGLRCRGLLGSGIVVGGWVRGCRGLVGSACRRLLGPGLSWVAGPGLPWIAGFSVSWVARLRRCRGSLESGVPCGTRPATPWGAAGWDWRVLTLVDLPSAVDLFGGICRASIDHRRPIGAPHGRRIVSTVVDLCLPAALVGVICRDLIDRCLRGEASWGPPGGVRRKALVGSLIDSRLERESVPGRGAHTRSSPVSIDHRLRGGAGGAASSAGGSEGVGQGSLIDSPLERELRDVRKQQPGQEPVRPHPAACRD